MIFKNLDQFLSAFSDEKACRAYFEKVRFSDGTYCPHCKNDKIHRFADGMRYRCYSCKCDFTIKTNTPFGESKLPMQKWFTAIYLLTTSKKDISSTELAEQVRVTQKTAWYMNHRIREALKQNGGKLFGDGIMEVEKMYVDDNHSYSIKEKRGRGLKKMTPSFDEALQAIAKSSYKSKEVRRFQLRH